MRAFPGDTRAVVWMGVCRRTFLRQSPPLVLLKLVLVPIANHGRIALGPGDGEVHGLVPELEALDVLDGLGDGFGVVVDDKGLALGLEVLLGHDVNDVAIVGEDDLERVDQVGELDALLEVPHVDAAVRVGG